MYILISSVEYKCIFYIILYYKKKNHLYSNPFTSDTNNIMDKKLATSYTYKKTKVQFIPTKTSFPFGFRAKLYFPNDTNAVLYYSIEFFFLFLYNKRLQLESG